MIREVRRGVLERAGGPSETRAKQSRFGVPWRGLHVDGQHVRGQARHQPGLDKRRFAAAARPVQQADTEGPVGIRLLKACLPEANVVGQAVAIARTGQQLQKEVGILHIEGAQPLGDNLDRGCVGVGRLTPARDGMARRGSVLSAVLSCGRVEG